MVPHNNVLKSSTPGNLELLDPDLSDWALTKVAWSPVRSQDSRVELALLLDSALVKRRRESVGGVLGFTHFTHLSFGQTSH